MRSESGPIPTSKSQMSTYSVIDTLIGASAAIRKYGWRPTADVSEDPSAGIVSTAEWAKRQFHMDPINQIAMDEQDVLIAERALNWMKSKQRRDVQSNDYEYKLWYLTQQEFITSDEIPLLVSLLNLYERQTRYEIQLERMREIGILSGMPGDRIKMKVKVITAQEFEGTFGQTMRIRAIDQDGRQVIFFTNQDIERILNENDEMIVHGVIKTQQVRSNIPESVLGRVSIRSVESERV